MTVSPSNGTRAPSSSFECREGVNETSNGVDPAVYEHLGIEGGLEMARANPHHTATIVGGLTKLTTFLTEIGVIDDAHRAAWSALVA